MIFSPHELRSRSHGNDWILFLIRSHVHTGTERLRTVFGTVRMGRGSFRSVICAPYWTKGFVVVEFFLQFDMESYQLTDKEKNQNSALDFFLFAMFNKILRPRWYASLHKAIIVMLSFSKTVSETSEDARRTMVLLIFAILYIPLERQQPTVSALRFPDQFYLFTRERNGTVAHRSTVTFFGPLFGTKVLQLNRSRMNTTAERSTFRNKTIWNGKQSFPCEHGLSPSMQFNVIMSRQTEIFRYQIEYLP